MLEFTTVFSCDVPTVVARRLVTQYFAFTSPVCQSMQETAGSLSGLWIQCDVRHVLMLCKLGLSVIDGRGSRRIAGSSKGLKRTPASVDPHPSPHQRCACARSRAYVD